MLKAVYLVQIERTRQQLRQGGNEPDIEDVARFLKMQPAEVQDFLRISREHMSWDAPVRGDPHLTVDATLENSAAQTSEEIALEEPLRTSIERALGRLTDREADVIRRQFGLGHARPESLSEIAERYTITKERVRQIELKALRKLRLRGYHYLSEFLDK